MLPLKKSSLLHEYRTLKQNLYDKSDEVRELEDRITALSQTIAMKRTGLKPGSIVEDVRGYWFQVETISLETILISSRGGSGLPVLHAYRIDPVTRERWSVRHFHRPVISRLEWKAVANIIEF